MLDLEDDPGLHLSNSLKSSIIGQQGYISDDPVAPTQQKQQFNSRFRNRKQGAQQKKRRQGGEGRSERNNVKVGSAQRKNQNTVQNGGKQINLNPFNRRRINQMNNQPRNTGKQIVGREGQRGSRAQMGRNQYRYKSKNPDWKSSEMFADSAKNANLYQTTPEIVRAQLSNDAAILVGEVHSSFYNDFLCLLKHLVILSCKVFCSEFSVM